MDVQSIYHKLPKNKFLQTWIVLDLDVLVSLLASAFVLVLTAILTGIMKEGDKFLIFC